MSNKRDGGKYFQPRQNSAPGIIFLGNLSEEAPPPTFSAPPQQSLPKQPRHPSPLTLVRSDGTDDFNNLWSPE